MRARAINTSACDKSSEEKYPLRRYYKINYSIYEKKQEKYLQKAPKTCEKLRNLFGRIIQDNDNFDQLDLVSGLEWGLKMSTACSQ